MKRLFALNSILLACAFVLCVADGGAGVTVRTTATTKGNANMPKVGTTLKPENDATTTVKNLEPTNKTNDSFPQPVVNNATSPAGPLVVKETEVPVSSSDEPEDNGRCVNMDVRMCLTTNCQWYRAKCVEKVPIEPKAPFPVPLPDNFADAARLFGILWENPPSQGDPRLWMIFLGGLVVLVVIIANLILLLVVWFCSRQMWSCCKRRNGNKKNDGKKRRIVLILPEGKKVPLEDYLIDCSGSKPRAKRIGRGPEQLFRAFHASLSNSSSSSRSNVPPVATRKEDLERPSTWPHRSDENSSIVTAAIFRKNKMSSPKFNSFGDGDGESSEFVSHCNFINPAFSVGSSQGSEGGMRLKHVVAKDEDWEDAATDVEIASCSVDDRQDDGNDLPTVVTAIDETASVSAVSSGNFYNRFDEIPLSTSSSDAEDCHLTRHNACKLHSVHLKLKRVSPPQVPNQPKKDDEIKVEVVEQEDEDEVVKKEEDETNI